jgi:RND family efflux transporter MFP subunit
MIAMSLTFTSAACSTKEASGAKEEQTEAKNVEVTAVSKESLDAISNLSGTLQPYDETVVSFEVAGRIVDMSANIGDSIKKGSVLTRMDASEYELQVEKASKTIQEAQAALNSSDAAIQSADVGIQSAQAGVASSDEAIKSAEANIKAATSRIHSVQASLDELNKGAREQEKTQAKLAVDRTKSAYNKISTDAERVKGLYEEGLVSKKDHEDIQLQLSNAKKDVENAEQSLSLILEGATEEQRKKVYASLEEAQAGQEQAQAGKGQSQAAKGQAIAGKEQAVAAKQQAVAAKGQSQAAYEQALVGKRMAELSLSKTALTSPISGVVLEKFVSNGQLVNAGTAVYKLGLMDQLKVLLPVPDKDIKEWQTGQEVNVMLHDQARRGKVNQIYPQTNAGTGTISVEVLLPNEKLDWFPGQVVKANRVSSENAGILVPIEAVISNGEEPYVFKEMKGKAVKAVVETGQLINNKIHIVSGLEEGDKIVTRGADLLFEGDAVKAAGGKGQ